MPDRPAVLIVEDEPVVLKVAGMALAAEGIEFLEAIDVPSASAMLEYNRFKVIITDLKLPGESGFEILRRARALTPRPQVIIITGYATIENALQSFDLGSFDFVPKPFDVDELTSVVTRALRFGSLDEAETRGEENRYFLGRHSWALLDPDGTVTLGAAETVAGVMGELESIDCRDCGDQCLQGQCLCTLSSRDGLSHRLWAPLSGHIITLNSDIAEDHDLINRDPFDSGWIARVIPNSLEKELPNLARRRGPVS